MSTEAGAIQREKAFSLADFPAWLWIGIGVYALVLIGGRALLNDSDTYWQIAVGQWILDHHALPRVDIYSFTKAGEPWMSSSWLAQVLYAASYNLAGWTGPVVLAASCIAATFALFTHILSRRIPAAYAVAVAMVVLALSMGHFLARPHVLVLPIMLAWANGLMLASERGQAPSPWLLPLIALWANLHGGFVFGLVLVGAFALDALWNADRAQRKSVVLRWAVFGIGALVACCATPYGWGSILAARKILDLGELLHLIYEWMPADFSKFSVFELAILAADRRRALWRRQAHAAADRAGAGPAAHGAVACQESRDLRPAAADRGAGAGGVAVRAAAGLARPHRGPDAGDGSGDDPARRLDMAAGGQHHFCTA